jgi:alcohol dehydrogenase
MRQYFEFFSPVKIVAGQKALEHIPFELGSLGSKRPMLVTDKGVHEAGLVHLLEQVLSEADVPVSALFDEVPSDSSTTVVTNVAKIYRAAQADALIAIGGGSVIDTAKGVNILVSEGGDDLEVYSGAGALTRKLRPLFVVPTTAGTGSEVTLVAVIKDLERGLKLPFTSSFLLPDAAILDPRMTLGLPPQLTAATAMDAMVHATESYISLAKNPLSDAYAVAAIRKISEHLVPTIRNPGDPRLRLELAIAATLAGIAFSNAMVGLVHALGHSVGARCQVHHGTCMGILLPHVLRYNLEARREEIGELLLPLQGADRYASTPKEQRPEATIAAFEALKDELHQLTGLPRSLSETKKVRREDLEAIAKLSLDDGSLVYNAVEADFDDALRLLQRAF